MLTEIPELNATSKEVDRGRDLMGAYRGHHLGNEAKLSTFHECVLGERYVRMLVEENDH